MARNISRLTPSQDRQIWQAVQLRRTLSRKRLADRFACSEDMIDRAMAREKKRRHGGAR